MALLPWLHCFLSAEVETKRKVDTSEKYLKWKFSKEKGKRGLYFEYKAVPKENSLVMIILFFMFILILVTDFRKSQTPCWGQYLVMLLVLRCPKSKVSPILMMLNTAVILRS